ncbi:hypothetical protein WG66_008043 [Moniliophthora roreri]|nr:hypothetical protein WG66_008043 [Moniliophthora roreri]
MSATTIQPQGPSRRTQFYMSPPKRN